jgi:hypothetical protein
MCSWTPHSGASGLRPHLPLLHHLALGYRCYSVSDSHVKMAGGASKECKGYRIFEFIPCGNETLGSCCEPLIRGIGWIPTSRLFNHNPLQ